jgi:opacity protein-like surface antigen
MRIVFVIIAFIVLLANAQSALCQKPRDHEVIGVRIGYARTPSRLDDNFGSGTALALHFTEKFHPFLGVDFSFGSLNMGETWRDDITQKIFASQHDAFMNVIFITAAPVVEAQVGKNTSLYLSGGIGLYSITLILDSGFFSASNSKYHPGLNAGGGAYYKLTTNWKLELNLNLHKIWTSTQSDDWFYVYSEGDRNPYFYQITIGAALGIK